MKLKELKPTERFSDRAENYARFRPSYPPELLDHLDRRTGGLLGAKVADIGAGTGIFSLLLLNRGAAVEAVEPNHEMRQAAIVNVGERAGFKAYPGTAENTLIPPSTVNLITCAQAFHWFDPVKARAEFSRILKPNGWVALIWNDQKIEEGFGKAYEELKIQHCGDGLKKVAELTGMLDTSLDSFFGGQGYESTIFDYNHELDLAGLRGRFFSTSYAPRGDTPEGARAATALEQLFSKFSQNNGKVRFEYRTELFLGH